MNRLFRFFGGFSKPEHEEILKNKTAVLESTVKELKLQKAILDQRYNILSDMLAQELLADGFGRTL